MHRSPSLWGCKIGDPQPIAPHQYAANFIAPPRQFWAAHMLYHFVSVAVGAY